ncbi:MAG: hypothetical protein JWO95_3408, partial [Verrucomicrobiales bacterium]|nr:hypothetical protein [Verrucomicrobiales bacterium]
VTVAESVATIIEYLTANDKAVRK